MDAGHRAKQTKKLEENGYHGTVLASMEDSVTFRGTLPSMRGLCHPREDSDALGRTLLYTGGL